MSDPAEGWGWPLSARRAHYFVGRTSLCGKWMFGGRLEAGNDASSDNCARCKSLLARREGKA